MRWRRVLPLLILALPLVVQEKLSAQSAGNSSSGMFGNRTTGTGTTASTGSAFGSNSPLSSLGQSNGQGTPTLNSANGVGGQARTSNSFVGANTGQSANRASSVRRKPPRRAAPSLALGVPAWAGWVVDLVVVDLAWAAWVVWVDGVRGRTVSVLA